MRNRPSLARILLPLLLLAAGCATTQMAAEWSNKEYAGRSLRGERVLVLCQAPDPTVQRLCEDELVNGVNSRGVTAVRLASDRAVGRCADWTQTALRLRGRGESGRGGSGPEHDACSPTRPW